MGRTGEWTRDASPSSERASWQSVRHLCYIQPCGPAGTRTPSDSVGATGRETMKKKTGSGFSKTPVSCMPEPVLRQLVRIAGLQEMTIWRSRKQDGHLSATVTQRSPRDSGSVPPGRSRSCSGKRGTRHPCARRDWTSPTRATFHASYVDFHINLRG